MVVRAMNEDFSWDASARQYEKLYDELAEEKRHAEELAQQAQKPVVKTRVRKSAAAGKTAAAEKNASADKSTSAGKSASGKKKGTSKS